MIVIWEDYETNKSLFQTLNNPFVLVCLTYETSYDGSRDFCAFWQNCVDFILTYLYNKKLNSNE